MALGAMRRRVLAGLTEVGQAVRSGRARFVMLAPNEEEVPGRGEERGTVIVKGEGRVGKGRICVVRESSAQVRGLYAALTSIISGSPYNHPHHNHPPHPTSVPLRPPGGAAPPNRMQPHATLKVPNLFHPPHPTLHRRS
ncbi:unnamed protein product [Closterium sp. Naga37s-1]|nr:unnamed protein product [Closterium sp. Naga37s-1]